MHPATRRRLWVLLVVVTALLAAMTAGCGSDEEGEAAAGREKASKVGLSLITLNNDYFIAERRGAEEAARRAGADLIVADAQSDASRQLNDVQNFIAQQVDAILIVPIDPDGIVPAIEAANEAGIPVVTMDISASGGEQSTVVRSDNVAGGRLAAQELIELVGGSGKVAELEGTPGVETTNLRHEGFSDEVRASGNVEVVARQTANFDRTQGLNVTENILQAHPDLEGIFAHNDEMALGAVRALGSRAGREVFVIGYDAVPDGLEAIRAGTLAGTIAQDPVRLGREAVEQGLAAAAGRPVKKEVFLPVQLVTEDNVEELLGG